MKLLMHKIISHDEADSTLHESIAIGLRPKGVSGTEDYVILEIGRKKHLNSPFIPVYLKIGRLQGF